MTEKLKILGDISRPVAAKEPAALAAVDYESYFIDHGFARSAQEIWGSADLSLEAQRHWYRRGQVGCLFARRAARNYESAGWETKVILLPQEKLTQAVLEVEFRAELALRARSASCQLVSFLFPMVRKTEDLIRLVRAIALTGVIEIASAEDIDGLTAISLQASLPQSDVKAWVLGLGPFSYLPPTRRAPSTEIIVRPKPKPAALFHRINQDRSISHLADMPLDMSMEYTELVWSETIKSVRRVLEHSPNRLSAAKTTFTVPTSLWNTTL